jgi:hypothetical protein
VIFILSLLHEKTDVAAPAVTRRVSTAHLTVKLGVDALQDRFGDEAGYVAAGISAAFVAELDDTRFIDEILTDSIAGGVPKGCDFRDSEMTFSSEDFGHGKLLG